LNHAQDFVVAPDDGVELAFLGQLGQVAAVFSKRGSGFRPAAW
jgi:hypothetical protein